MTPEQEQMIKHLRSGIERKSDPVERQDLLEKLVLVEHDLDTEPQRQREAAEAAAFVVKAKRTLFWSRFIVWAFGFALLGAVALFWAKALHVF